MTGFVVDEVAPLTLARHNRLADMYVLSPFVWKVGRGFEILLRAVPRRDDEPRLKMAEVWWGRSSDGLHFEMADAPVLWGGPDLNDLDGCEDPTVVVDRGRTHVWYTGWNQNQATGRLLYAAGPDARVLAKQRLALDSRPPYANPKEATVARGSDGWHLLFEYAEDGASKIGRASAADLEGPWQIDGPLFEARRGNWDDWHLSTGPVVGGTGHGPVMFYNGATHDAHWRIGWIELDKTLSRVVSRGDEPLVTPAIVGEGSTDIAFAASAVEKGPAIHLYYSVSDKDMFRATVRQK